jgi:HD-GYP domain-containing protein (c-di-GMP phosphodiesterase class II)
MDVESTGIEEQLGQLNEHIGEPLGFSIYIEDQPIAARGQPITESLILKLSQLDPKQLRFSREGLGPELLEEDIAALVEDKIRPNAAEIVLEAGVGQDLTDEMRTMATRKVKEIFESCRYLTKLDLAATADLAVSLIQRVSSLDSAAFKLHDLRQYDEYTYYHSVNVCVLGTTLFREFVTNDQELVDMGIGLLLHDIGKSKIDLKILNKPTRLTEDEFAVMTRHVVYGHNLVKEHDEIAPMAKDLVLNHHERINGTGYSRGLRESQLTFFDMVAAVCDVVDAVTTSRSYRAKMDVHRAVSILIRGSGIHFQTRIVNHFLRGIGRFPVGTFVLLSSGEIGVVCRVNSSALALPVIRIVFDQGGNRLPEPVTIDLYEQRDLYIERPLDVNYTPAGHSVDTNPPL